MDRWKAEMGRVREQRRVEERRSEKRRSQKKKMQMREKVGKSRNTVFQPQSFSALFCLSIVSIFVPVFWVNKTNWLHKPSNFIQTSKNFHNFGSIRSFVFADWFHWVVLPPLTLREPGGERGPARFGPFVPFLPQVSAWEKLGMQDSTLDRTNFQCKNINPCARSGPLSSNAVETRRGERFIAHHSRSRCCFHTVQDCTRHDMCTCFFQKQALCKNLCCKTVWPHRSENPTIHYGNGKSPIYTWFCHDDWNVFNPSRQGSAPIVNL